VKVLASLALFRGVPKTSVEQLARFMRLRRYARGDVVFHQGDPAREFFVLVTGRVVVTVKGGDPDGPPIAVLAGPTWFGDLAIVSNQTRISTVTTATDCEFWVLARTHFEAFFNRHPRMARNLAAALIRRLQEKDRDFTSQATLALERARLLEALRQGADEMAALTDVTRAINASLDLDQALRSISTYAARLTKSDSALIFLNEQGRDVFSVRASYNAPAGYVAEIGERHPPLSAPPEALDRSPLTVRAVVERRPVQIADVRAALLYRNRDLLMRWGYRAVLVVPLLHDDRVIGAMSVLRRHPGEFTQGEVELVRTFAGHSAIAIEHARLFQEVQAQNRALKEALEHQTVTSEFLKSINRTTFELQPTLETLVEHATDLCGAAGGLLFTFENGAYRWVADHGTPPAFRRHLQENPIHPGRGGLADRTAKEGRPVHIPDVLADPEYRLLEAQRAGGYRSVLGIPLLRDGNPIGVITTYRTEVQPFAEKEIERLTSFAEMAVTAIEKLRLFRELQARTEELAESVGELRALTRTIQAVNSSLNRDRVLSAIAEQACRLCQADAGLITELVEPTREFRPAATWNVSPEFVQRVLVSPPTWGKGITGQSAAGRGAVQIPDVRDAEGYPWRDVIAAEGFRAILSVPLLHDDRVVGTIAVARKTAGGFAERFVNLLTTFANQASIALEHARLFQQLQEKAAQLEVVSRHKSQFLANMSHELRTPLNAIIGFSEVLLDSSLGPLADAERQEFLTNILTSGKHLLRLINDVLDLSKIEAGKMDLRAEAVSLTDTVEGVLATVRTLATRKRIHIRNEISVDHASVCADPARLKQILYNLLSNAIKFTPEGGRVTVAARRAEGGAGGQQYAEVSVTDSGIGIPAAHLERIFEEFEQVTHPAVGGQEGTGLGLAMVKKLVEMQGGTVHVASVVGEGSTFSFTIPLANE
jgi:signal transduction histidine kinase/CRP-like cAMP-binding protein